MILLTVPPSIFPKDRLFDDKKEEFEFELKDLGKGVHTITMRAIDQENNIGSVSKEFEGCNCHALIIIQLKGNLDTGSI
jgi:hypothetical protein